MGEQPTFDVDGKITVTENREQFALGSVGFPGYKDEWQEIPVLIPGNHVKNLRPNENQRFTIRVKAKQGRDGRWWPNLSVIGVMDLAPPLAPGQQGFAPQQAGPQQQQWPQTPPNDETPF